MPYKPEYLDSAFWRAPDGEEWECALYKLPPYWWITGNSSSSTEYWNFYTDYEEVKAVWAELKDIPLDLFDYEVRI